MFGIGVVALYPIQLTTRRIEKISLASRKHILLKNGSSHQNEPTDYHPERDHTHKSITMA